MMVSSNAVHLVSSFGISLSHKPCRKCRFSTIFFFFLNYQMSQCKGAHGGGKKYIYLTILLIHNISFPICFPCQVYNALKATVHPIMKILSPWCSKTVKFLSCLCLKSNSALRLCLECAHTQMES